MKKILEILNRNIVLTTAVQIGIDGDISEFICDYFWETCFVDSNCDWVWKTLPSHPFCSKYIFSEEADYIQELNETEPIYDFAYIHDRNSKDFQRHMFIYMIRHKFKIILVHPNIICFDPPGYNKISIRTQEDGEYKLYYLDIIYEDLECYFKSI